MRETWYVLEDGSVADPNECAPNENGRLAHKRGLVALREDGETPRSRSVDVDAVNAEAKADAPAPAKPEGKSGAAPKQTDEMKPAAKPKAPKKSGYKTREA